MEEKKFAHCFKQDHSYYDLEKRELNKILSLVDFKQDQTLIDIGAGIGRLSIPLSQYVKVTSIESNKELLNNILEKGITKINQKIEDFYPKEKFDFALIAWPHFEDYNIIFKHIKENILKDGGQLIIIKSKKHSLREITRKLFPDLFNKGKKFLDILSEYFEIDKEELIETKHTYPHVKEAQRLMIFELEGFYGKNIDGGQEKILFQFIKEHENSGKVVMNAQLRVILCRLK